MRIFAEAAKRDERLVNVRVTANLSCTITVDDYDFEDFNSETETSESGVYRMPASLMEDIDCIDDLDDDRIEHLYDTDLQLWYAKAQNLSATVEIQEGDVDAEEA